MIRLRNRLSIYSILIFSVIIIIVSIIIYLTFYSTMEKKEMKSLENKSLIAAFYYLEQDELSFTHHENIKNKLLKTISRKDIAIYNIKNDKKVYGKMSEDLNITDIFLEQVNKEKSASFSTASFFYSGIFYTDNQGDFIVVVRESKDDFNDQMNLLLKILSGVSIISLIIIYFFSQYLGYIAYQPIIHFINQIKNRNSANFIEPIVLKDSYTEIRELSNSYNQFINQISETFTIQKNFIDYVSHELRTPIAALIGTLEVTTHKSRSVEEYQDVLIQLKQHTIDLQESIDQMMLLSGTKTDFELVPTRIDEVIWEIVENQIVYHQANINVLFDVENEQLLMIKGNSKLLNLAIGNIVSNAIKYSDNQEVKIQFTLVNNQLVLNVIDNGVGIDEDELPLIRQNFYRGKNIAISSYQGNGIGLSLADVIFKIHNITLDIKPNLPKGTIMSLTF